MMVVSEEAVDAAPQAMTLATPPQQGSWWRGLAGWVVALAAYTYLSVLFFGGPVIGHFTTRYVGDPVDGPQFMWFLAWWPHALTHGLNPLLPQVAWAPTGFNLTWATSIPALSVALAPVTLQFGVVAAYNVMMLAIPTASAFCGFLLIRRLTSSWFGGLVGGYLFGFSTLMLGAQLGHPQVSAAFVLPLLVYAVVRGYQNSWPAWITALLCGVLFTVQFLLGPELYAIMALALAVTAAAALVLVSSERGRVFDLILMIGAGFELSIFIVSPVLHVMLGGATPQQPINSPDQFSIDLLGVVMPGQLTWLGGGWFRTITATFAGNASENGAYLGLPLVAILVAYAVTINWRSWRGVNVVTSLVFLLFSLGPVMNVGGQPIIRLPWAFITHVPLLQNVLPARCMAVVWLCAAIATADWLTQAARSVHRPAFSLDKMVPWASLRVDSDRLTNWPRVALGALALVFLLPSWNTLQRYYWTSLDRVVPPFFSAGNGTTYFYPGESVVLLPFGRAGAAMADQALSAFQFTMPEGYAGTWVPVPFDQWAIVDTLQDEHYDLSPAQELELRAFLGTYRVEEVVVNNPVPPELAQTLAAIGFQEGLTKDGVTFFPVPPDFWSLYQGATPASVHAMVLDQEFLLLYQAAQQGLQGSVPRGELSPLTLESANLLPSSYGGYQRSSPDWNRTADGAWVGPLNGGFAVGVTGNWHDLSHIAQEYANQDAKVYFPYPAPLQGTPNGDTTGELRIAFGAAPATVATPAPIAQAQPVTTPLPITSPLPEPSPPAPSAPALLSQLPALPTPKVSLEVVPLATPTASPTAIATPTVLPTATAVPATATAVPATATAVPATATAVRATATAEPAATPSAEPVATAAPTVTYVLYTVQQHDDLYQIAKQFHVTIPAIQAANGMGNSTFIFPGERLLIPLLASS